MVDCLGNCRLFSNLTRLAGLISVCLLALLLTPSLAQAEALYWRYAQAAQPSPEQMAESEKLIRAHKEAQYQEKMRVPPFHLHVAQPIPQAQAFCQNCHGPLPHSQKLRTRAFMNMHSRFIACETCHFRPKDVKLEYRWQARPGQPPAAQQPLRIGLKLDNAVSRTGEFHIAPFFHGEAANLAQDDPLAQPWLEQWKNATLPEKALLRAKLHAPLALKGPDCGQCHAEKQGLLDFAALGATAEQEQAIRNHIIPRFFGHYQDEGAERIRILDLTR
jgi:hypothetical protein